MAQAKKRKQFFDIKLPIVGKETQLQGFELSDLNGRIINYDLTRLLKGKSAMLQMKITVEGDKASVSPRQIKLLPYFLKRMVRKGTNYVEDSFFTACKDGEVIIKPFLVTRRKVSRKVRKALREKAREELIKYALERTKDQIFDDVVKNQLQKPLSLTLKKIYPLSLCEIRILKVKEKIEQ